jgi:hypothetical protein
MRAPEGCHHRPLECAPSEAAQSSRASWCSGVNPICSLCAAWSPCSQHHRLPTHDAAPEPAFPTPPSHRRSQSCSLQARIEKEDAGERIQRRMRKIGTGRGVAPSAIERMRRENERFETKCQAVLQISLENKFES